MTIDAYEAQQHYVTFHSPGTFVHETSTEPIDSWDIDHATAMAMNITERYGASPFAFRFSTRARKARDLDATQIEQSPLHFLGGTVRTLAQVIADDLPDEQVLRSNMRANGIDRVVTNTNSYKVVVLLGPNDVVLDFTPQETP